MVSGELTLDETVAYLNRSELATLVTEGSQDYRLLRNLEAFGSGTFNCLPVGGRSSVLLMRDRLYSKSQTAFLVDADLWLFGVSTDKPQDTKSLIITSGYSIENDLLEDSRPDRLIENGRRASYQRDLDSVVVWFASKITERLAGRQIKLNLAVKDIVANGIFTPLAQAQVDKYCPPDLLVNKIMDEHPRLLRGKTWLDLLARYLCVTTRDIAHHRMSLLETAWLSNGANAARLIAEINSEICRK